MAYQEVSATSISVMMSAIKSFCEGLGFTTHHYAIVGDNIVFTFNGGLLTDYCTIYCNTVTGTMYTMQSIGFSAGATTGQPSRGAIAETNLLTVGPYQNIHMFGENGAQCYVHFVLEIATGVFRHFGVGMLEKVGTWVGGGYNFGTYWGQSASAIDSPTDTSHALPFSATNNAATRVGSIRCDDCDATGTHLAGVDTRYPMFSPSYARKAGAGWIGSNAADVAGNYTKLIGGYLDLAPIYFNNRTVLAPFSTFVSRASGFRTILGQPPQIRAANISAYSPKEEISIGPDTWKIFPLVRKYSVTDNTEASFDYAIAYKKVI